ncbi:MAG: PepSY domain-containing protein [Clostridiales bacterium]|nr:PepSY domain-containing protein [Clostridiales bacterium]
MDAVNGRLLYEGEVRKSGTEYDFEIDATTGMILEWEAKPEDRD